MGLLPIMLILYSCFGLIISVQLRSSVVFSASLYGRTGHVCVLPSAIEVSETLYVTGLCDRICIAY